MSTEQVQPKIEERIYIGNVDYAVNEEELKGFFEDLKVTDVDIPSKTFTRNKKTIEKHLGFAFVQFETKADAEKAIETFNGKEFRGRNIYVKRALPVPTPEEKQQKVEAFKAKKAEQLAKKAAKTKAKTKAKKLTTSAGDSKLKDGDETSKNGEAATADATSTTTTTNEKDEAASSSEESKLKTPEGKASVDTVFITNLDYKVDVKTLNSIFKDLKPKWIHVPTRKVPFYVLKKQKKKGRTVFNKGIAFVKFSNEELQKKAIAEFNGKELNGRQIILDIAIDARIPKSDEDEEEDEEEEEEEAVNGDGEKQQDQQNDEEVEESTDAN